MRWHEWTRTDWGEDIFTNDLVARLAEVESAWYHSKRPYYSVMPQIGEALARVNLDTPSGGIGLPLDNLLVRFQVGHELDAGQGASISKILVNHAEYTLTDPPPGIREAVCHRFVLRIAGDFGNSIAVLALHPDFTLNENLHRANLVRHGENTLQHTIDVAFALVIAICLLDEGSGLIAPEVLTDDQAKYEAANAEERARLVDKARRRGRVGWMVGADVEVSPHLRRPHFGIRWTEKGRSVPKIVPIKGCVVKRKAIGEVPTGYLDASLCRECRLRPAADGEHCSECLKTIPES